MRSKFLRATVPAAVALGLGGAGVPPATAAAPVVAATAGTTMSMSLASSEGRSVSLPAPYAKVAVVNPQVADVIALSRTEAQIVARGPGATDVAFFDEDGKPLLRIAVSVVRDVAAADSAAKAAAGPSVRAAPVADLPSLSGPVPDAGSAAAAGRAAQAFAPAPVINQTKVLGSQQVLLQVKVAEVQRSVLKDLGVGASFASSGGALSAAVTGKFGDEALGAIKYATRAAGGSLNAVINSLEKNGLVAVLAEPNLTATSGATAELLAGGEFPVPVPQGSSSGGSASGYTIEFKQFGVALGFTPVVVGPDMINLNIATEVSGLSSEGAVTMQGLTIPALTVRRARTTVDLPSGGSIVMAGMLQNNLQTSAEGLPWMKDVPVLGRLFSSTSFRRDESELVITVTAHLVRPVSAKDLALPTDGVAAPSDVDLHLMGHLESRYARGRKAFPAQTMGYFGYIVE